MSKLRVMFVGHGPSNLPEDRVVNTFHFNGPGPSPTDDMETAFDAVQDFYLGVGTGTATQSRALATYFSMWVKLDAELRGYNLEDAKPRVPTIRPLVLPGAGAADGLPEEVCVVASVSGQPPVTPRRRGRLYLGPLNSLAVSSATGSQPARPTTGFQSDIRWACMRLAGISTGALDWSVRSTLPSENFVTIVQGFIDNACDTQRRRGPDTTARLSWNIVG